MLLKSRSCTHHPHMHYSYTGGRRKNMPSTKKCFTPTLGVNTKILLIGSPQNKCSKLLLLSLKSFVAEKKHWAMQKLFMKKQKKELRKNGQVSEIFKTMGTQMPA